MDRNRKKVITVNNDEQLLYTVCGSKTLGKIRKNTVPANIYTAR
jgi:hypothetical protein